MRVIAGELGGRRLEAPPGADVRPTADRTREALYSILGDIDGLSVLDLYCGTGALGIEALSRGARGAVLVDTRLEPARVNVEALGLEVRAKLVRRDAIRYLAAPGPRFDLILCDPPYSLADRLEPELRQLVPGRLAELGRLVVESPARSPLALDPDLRLEVDRRYGEASLRIWRQAG